MGYPARRLVLPQNFETWSVLARQARQRLGECPIPEVIEGQTPAERPVFRKLHGAAHGRLEMVKDIPADLKVGVFAHDSLTAWMRFSSDTSPTSPDLKSTVGIGLKVFGVPGDKAYGGVPNVKTEIGLHILAYNLKRVIAILGVGPLMRAIRA